MSLEELKNFVIYKQYAKDEDVSIWPIVLIGVLVLVAYGFAKLFS